MPSENSFLYSISFFKDAQTGVFFRHFYMHKSSFFFLTASLTLSLFASACHDDEAEKEAQFQAKVEKTRTVLGNHCSNDSDCMITGCHLTMCRAMPEPEYCDQRIVLAIDDEADIPMIKSLVTDQLTVREAESVRLGGYAAGRWTLSFLATQTQRERIETALNHLPQSGFARLHPKSDMHSEALFERMNDDDTALVAMKGAGKLVEKQIRSGDVLSKEDIRNTWTQAAPMLNVNITPDDDIERLWAYDVIFDRISKLRFWPVDKRQRISARMWQNLESRVDNGDLILTAQLKEAVVPTFKSWIDSGKIIVVLLGNEIVASAIPDQAIDDGHFELVIHDGAKNETLMASIDTLKAVSKMKGAVHVDDEATANVERDIVCTQKYPRQCACINGSCGWKISKDYNACLFNLKVEGEDENEIDELAQ